MRASPQSRGKDLRARTFCGRKKLRSALDSGLDQDDGPAVELSEATSATGRPAKVEAEKVAAKALSIVTPFCKAVPTVLKQLPSIDVEKDGTAEADVLEDEAEALRRSLGSLRLAEGLRRALGAAGSHPGRRRTARGLAARARRPEGPEGGMG